MRPFQQSTRSALRRLVRGHGVSLEFDTVEVEPNPAIRHETGDVYLRTAFTSGDHSYELYVYTDEAEADVDSHHLAFELPDFNHDEKRLQKAYVWFLGRALAGADIIETYWKCRKQGASLTIA